MSWFFLIAMVLIILAVIAVKLKSQKQHSEGYPYSKNQTNALLTSGMLVPWCA